MPVTPTLPPSHTPYWVPHIPHTPTHHFATTGLGSLDGGGSSSGGGYQVVTDPLTRQVLLVHHPAIQDVSMWGYGGQLMAQQMLLADQHFTRTLHPHPALLHASTLHPTLHHATPTIHQPAPAFHQVAPCHLNIPAPGIKIETPRNTAKNSDDDDPKMQVFIAPSAASTNITLAASVLSSNLHQTAMPSVLGSSLVQSLPSAIQSVLPSAMQSILPSAIQSVLPSAMQSVLPSAVQSALPSVMQSVLPPSIQSALPPAIPSGISSVLPAGITQSLASAIQPSIPHYLYPPTSLPLFCQKPPVYPMSAFVQSSTSPIISVIPSTASTAPSACGRSNMTIGNIATNDNIVVSTSIAATISMATTFTIAANTNIAANVNTAANTNIATITNIAANNNNNNNNNNNMTACTAILSAAKTINTVAASVQNINPHMIVLSPQLTKSLHSKPEQTLITSSNHTTMSPTLVPQPKQSPLFISQSSPSPQSSLPKTKLSKLQKSSTKKVTSPSSVVTKVEHVTANIKLSIKKEIKQEILSPIASLEKEVKCVDLSMSNSQKIKSGDTKSIKKESGVPDSAKSVLNQRRVALSTNLSKNYDINQLVQFPCLNSSSVHDISPRTSLSEFSDNRITTVTTSQPNISLPSTRYSDIVTNTSESSYLVPVQATPVAIKCPSEGHVFSSEQRFAPVQEQALDLSGLELLSRSVLQHAGRLVSDVPVTQPRPTHGSVGDTVVDAPPALCTQSMQPALSMQSMQPALCTQSTQPALCTQTTQPAMCMQSTQPALCTQTTQPAMCTQPALCTQTTQSALFIQTPQPELSIQSTLSGSRELVVNKSTSVNENNSSVNSVREISIVGTDNSSTIDPNAKISNTEIISSPSSLQPSNYRNNFSLLCALAEQKLLEDGQKEESPRSTASSLESSLHVVTTPAKTTFPNNSNVETPIQSGPCRKIAINESSILSKSSNERCVEDAFNTDCVNLSELESSQAHCANSLATSQSDSYTSDWTNKSNACVANSPFSTCSSYSSPLDLSISLSKKSSSGHSSLSTVNTSAETVQYPNQTNINSVMKSVEISHKYDNILTTKKLLLECDSSSSDNQNFEGFDDSSKKKAEMNMRRQLAVLERQYREKVRDLQRQYPNQEGPSSKRKPGRPRKRKRYHSESSKRKVGRSRKQSRLDDHKELSPPGFNRTSDIQIKSYHEVSSDDEEERLKQVPRLTISGLNPQTMGGEMKVSPRLESRVRVPQFSSEGEYSPYEDSKNKPHRRWSLSFITKDEKLHRASKVHISPRGAERVESEDDQMQGNMSDSSGHDSKAINTETSVESSLSEHEMPFASCSSSKKRKPGRPKKHSPSKKDATETIVAKKHRNLNFIMHHPSIVSSKSKMKPKLKAETREIQLNEEFSSVSDSQDDSLCYALEAHPTERGNSSKDPTSHLVSDYTSLMLEVDSPAAKSAAFVTSTPVAAGGLPDAGSGVPTSSSVATLSGTSACIAANSSPSRGSAKRHRGTKTASLTRRAIMRDKEKRKTDAEQQCQMEALFRTLKKRSTIANAEHDESEDDADSDQSLDVAASGYSLRLGDDVVQQDEAASYQNVEVKKETEACQVVGKHSVAFDEARVKMEPVINSSTCCPLTTQAPAVPPSASLAPCLGPLQAAGPPSVCLLTVPELVEGCRVVCLRDDGLLYAGSVRPIDPPDLYSVVIDGERGSKAHIYCAEEMLAQSWKEVKPGSTRFLKEGTRVCCFWSQQYRALYSGTVGSASSSPTHSDASTLHNFVNVEFDDGDSGRIHVDDIRLLPQDYPVTVPKPNALLTLGTRKRRQPNRDSVDSKPPAAPAPAKSVAVVLPRATEATPATVGKTATKVTKKNKPKKKKKASKKQQKRYNKDWDNESDMDSNEDSGREDDEEECRLNKKMKLNTNNEQSNLATKSEEGLPLPDHINGDRPPACPSVATETSSVVTTNNSSSSVNSTSSLLEDGELKEKTVKKKKKKHSKSDDHHHKKRKHKHKKSKNKDELSDGRSSDLTKNYEGSTSNQNMATESVTNQQVEHYTPRLQLFPRVETVDGDLRMRIKSPPPTKLKFDANKAFSIQVPPTTTNSPDTGAQPAPTPPPTVAHHAYPPMATPSKRDQGAVGHTSQRIKDAKQRSPAAGRDTSRPKRSLSRAESVTYEERTDDSDDESSTEDELSNATSGEQELLQNKNTKHAPTKSRRTSGSSVIAAFLTAKDLWKWSGNGSKKSTGKGRGRKIFYKEIVRGNESIRVGDCCVFRSSGPPDNPYIGRIEHLCEGWNGSRTVTVHWFYHPDEISGEPKKLKQPKGALFESNHHDTNDLQTISYKCQVLTLTEYRARVSSVLAKSSVCHNNNNNTEEHSARALETLHQNNQENLSLVNKENRGTDVSSNTEIGQQTNTCLSTSQNPQQGVFANSNNVKLDYSNQTTFQSENSNATEKNPSEKCSGNYEMSVSRGSNCAIQEALSTAPKPVLDVSVSPIGAGSDDGSSSTQSTSSSSESDDEKCALTDCYYLAGNYDVVHQSLRMEPGVE